MTQLSCVSAGGEVNYSKTKLVVGGTSTECASCAYEATLAATPKLATISTAANDGYDGSGVQTILLTGENFPVGSTAHTPTMGGVLATTSTIDSATQITLTFDKGVGFGTDLAITELIFQDGKHSTIDPAAKKTFAFSATSPVSAIDCSYGGGCLWALSGANVNMLASSLTATVCGYPCLHDATASTKDEFKCRAPLLPTAHSIATYSDLVPSQNWLDSNGVNGIMMGASSLVDGFADNAFDKDVTN